VEYCAPGTSPHCETSDSWLVCCGDTHQTFCETTVPGGEGCWTTGVDCSTVQSCGGQARACQAGGTAHCTADGGFLCCGGSYPTFCDARNGASANCFGSGIDCSTVTPCGGRDHACPTGGTPSCRPDGGFSCAGQGRDGDDCQTGADCQGGQCLHWNSFPTILWCSSSCTSDADCDSPTTCQSNGVCGPDIQNYCSADRTQVLGRDKTGREYGVIQTCSATELCGEGSIPGNSYCRFACANNKYDDECTECTFGTYDPSTQECCGTCYYVNADVCGATGSYSSCAPPTF
jgi:hypothetical protein